MRRVPLLRDAPCLLRIFFDQTAETLEHEHQAAATILYRALLDDILKAARSKAYGHGAKYLGKLALLAEAADPTLPEGVKEHQA